MHHSVVIATYNREADLRQTLASLAGLRPRRPWELLVVDNNSRDGTRQVVEEAARTFPAELRYLFEGEQGRSPALNTGIRAARGQVIITTDDDVRVEEDWLDQAQQGLDLTGADYIGGPVLPIWGRDRPRWLSEGAGRQWAVIALLDYGSDPLPFDRRHVPLGVNMAFRREAFDRAGLFDPRIGRRAGTLLGQEVREWGTRARRAGVSGWYVPSMRVRHVIPADRLQRAYFRRWFYWHGVSRALLYQQAGLDLEAPEQHALPAAQVHSIAGVPRYLYRTCLSHLAASIGAAARGRSVEAFEHELWVWFFAGVVRQRWRDRRLPAAAVPPHTTALSA